MAFEQVDLANISSTLKGNDFLKNWEGHFLFDYLLILFIFMTFYWEENFS